ncbi:hypothetical protein [Steroidobacter gossypii]|nr:hypothetical protein [Steroidobacter gossypii]
MFAGLSHLLKREADGSQQSLKFCDKRQCRGSSTVYFRKRRARFKRGLWD